MTEPLSPSNCTVLGYTVTATDPMWTGLDLSRAEIGRDLVGGYCLSVPWLHPDDRVRHINDPDWWAFYCVRPRKHWRSFVRVDGVWHVSEEKPE